LESSKIGYYHPELDALRFFAATAVFLGHWLPADRRFVTLLTGSGIYGVDLFFALSSFLITNLLLQEREAFGGIDLRAFYIRRILRIWPLYFFFIGIAYALTFFSHAQQLAKSYVIGMLLLYGNWVFVTHGLAKWVANPLWSICVEEQFYVCWPTAMRRLAEKSLTKIAVGMLLVGFLTRLFLAPFTSSGYTLWFNTFVRLDPFALGILMCVWLKKRPAAWGLAARICMGVLGSLCWVAVTKYAYLLDSPQLSVWRVTIGYSIVSAGSCAMLLAVYDAPKVGIAFLANKNLAYLGKLSYGIYVYHALVQAVAAQLLMRRVIWGPTSFVFTIAIAAISYRFLEKPFLDLKSKFELVKSRPA
jgi:peptidoglycan/LPS O-acetylase OafA/YrhL